MLHHQALTQPGRRLTDHHHLGHAAALVFIVLTPGPSRRGVDRLAHFAQKLQRTLVKAHYRAGFVQREQVRLNHLFHAGDKLFVDLCDAPLLLLPGLEFVFLSNWRTPWWLYA